MLNRFGVVSLVAALVGCAASARAQCSGTFLQPFDTPHMRFVAPVVSDPDGPGPRAGVVYALGFPRGTILQPGRWSTFDGSMWSTLPGTPPGGGSLDAGIRAVTLDGQLFTSDLWRWDGTAWTRINLASDGSVLTVSALATHQGSVVAYATSPTLGRAIYRWTGATWTVLTPAVKAGNSSWHVSARVQLLSDGASLYVLDNMATMNGVAAPGVARWDGTTWSTLGGGIGGQIRSAKIINGQLYVGGAFLSEGTNVRGSLRRWTGSAWQIIQPAGSTSELLVNDFVEADGRLILMGVNRINFTGPGAPYGIVDLATNAYTLVQGEQTTNLETFGGLVRLGDRTLAMAAIANNGALTINSVLDEVFPTSSVNLRWSILFTPNFNSIVIQRGRPISRFFPGTALEYVAGGWRQSTTSPANLDDGFDFENQTYRFVSVTSTSSRIERLDGTIWTPLGQAVPFTPMRLARFGPTLVAYGTSGANSFAHRWNGTDWEPFLAPIAGIVSEMIYYKDEPYAIGGIQSANGALWFLRFDGTQWVRVAQGIETINSERPTDMHVDPQNRLWVVGPIARTIGASTTSVSMVVWDGISLTGYAGPTSTGLYETGDQLIAIGTGISRLVNGVASFEAFPEGAVFSTPVPAFGNEVHGLVSTLAGPYIVRMSLDGKPRIFRQPESASVACGQTTRISIKSTAGLADVTYQWLHDGAPLTDTPVSITTGPIIEGATSANLRLINASAAQAGMYTCQITTACGSVLSSPAAVTVTGCAPACDSIDFNNNGAFPEDQDVIDFLTVLAGGSCSPGNTCNDIDFNNNGAFPEDQDVIDFFNVLAGGECL